MKQTNTIKNLLSFVLIGVAFLSNAQTSIPLKFNLDLGTNGILNNYHKDYVGTRLQVSAPMSIAGDLDYTTSAPSWGGAVITPLVDIPIIMGAPDTFGCSPFTAGSMTGKIAFVWRGPISGACEFGVKALAAQNAGAIACVLINEYPGEGPVGMAAGAAGASVTIPVFMIGNLDGIRISAQYHALPAGTVKMTITPWGRGNQNDLGFVPGGVSVWHNDVIPAYQLTAATNPIAYKGIDGAFVANYGSKPATHVKLSATLNYTPTGGTSTVLHTDTVSLASFPAIDSIHTMFSPEYDLAGVTGKGQFDLKYTITSDSVDQFNFDNSYTHTFYTTDSLFSKGRYDFAKQHPIATQWSGTTYLVGVPYYVAKGGAAFKNVQFSASSGPGLLPSSTYFIFYVFKWVDGSLGVGSQDNLIEGGELTLVAASNYVFNGTSDSSFNFFTSSRLSADTSAATFTAPVKMQDNSWYLVAAEHDPSTNIALGYDGILTQYPRSYGRKHFNSITELYNPIASSKDDIRATPTGSFLSYAYGGGSDNVDSVVYNTQNGLVPALALNTTPYVVGVNETKQIASKFELSPNPADDYVTIDIDLINKANKVSYTLINNMAQIVRTETKENVQSDRYTINTSILSAGNYYIVVAVDGKPMFKKFTVIKR